VATRRSAAVLLQAIPELGIEYFLLNLVVAVVVGYFTYRNAESRGESGLLWGGVVAAASFFLSLVGFLVVFLVYYLVVVRD
jgi:N-acyl-D-aspartate/D-glutamate deacylase